jgi:hypothetical protein
MGIQQFLRANLYWYDICPSWSITRNRFVCTSLSQKSVFVVQLIAWVYTSDEKSLFFTIRLRWTVKQFFLVEDYENGNDSKDLKNILKLVFLKEDQIRSPYISLHSLYKKFSLEKSSNFNSYACYVFL